MNVDPDDPESAAIEEANQRAQVAEQKAMQLEVRGKVRDLIADDRFKNIPESTKELILQTPHMLSNADSLDEAMFDIEDKLVDIAEKVGTDQGITPEATPQTPPGNPPTQSVGETPPVVTPGAPAPVDAAVLQDTENLRGTERSVAALGNAFKKQNIPIRGPEK